MRNKKGKLSTALLNSAILAIVLLVVLFKIYATMMPTLQTAGNEINATGVQFGSLFAADGIIFIIIMAALLLVIVRSFMSNKGS